MTADAGPFANVLPFEAASHSVLAAAFLAIPLSLVIFMRRRRDLHRPHKVMAILFAIFLGICGVSQIVSLVSLWRPIPLIDAAVRAVGACMAVVTAVWLPLLFRQLLDMPSPRSLLGDLEEHKATLAELQQAREQLAHRVSTTEVDLRETSRRFEAALNGSPITIFEQDADFQYTWVYNPALGIAADDFPGRTEADLLSSESTATLHAIKAQTFATGQPQREEVFISRADGAQGRWFDLRIEPIILRRGSPGIIATSTDITELKRQQEHLRIVLRELNHRAKNLLTLVISIARQTAKGLDVPPTFTERLQDRLKALANAHDVLAVQEWRGADLRSIIEGQLMHQLETYGTRIVVEGPCVDLPPEAAHYIGMALHELGANAVKYGALAADAGQVLVRWSVDHDILRLEWRETGAALSAGPVREGFGSRILRELTPSAVAGYAEFTFGSDGVRWTLTAPLEQTERVAA